MTEMIQVRPNAATNVSQRVRLSTAAVVAGGAETAASGVVFMIPKGQEYFWSPSWQAFEREASQDLASGRTATFDDPREAFRWLLDGEEEEEED